VKKFLTKLPLPVLQSLIYGIAIALSKGVGFLLIPVLTHYLEPADYGRLDILQTLADLLTIVFACGLGDCLFRFAKDQDNLKLVSSLYSIALIISAVTVVLTQVIAPYVMELLPGSITLVQMRLILLTICLSPSILIPLSWLRLQGKAGEFFKNSVGRTMVQSCLVVLFLTQGNGLTGVLWAGTITSIAATLRLYFLMKNEDVSLFKFTNVSKYFVYGSPLIMVGIAGFILGSFDRLILASVVGPAEMAIYALAAKFALVVALLAQPFDMWWTPVRFKTLKEKNGIQKCANTCRLGIIYITGVAVFVAAVSPVILVYIVPISYHGAAQYIPFLCGLIAVHLITNILNLGCYSAKTTKTPMFIDIFAALLALVGYILLIPTFEIMGTIYATTIALSIRLILMMWVGQKTKFIPYDTKIISSLVALPVLFLISSTLIENSIFYMIIGFILIAFSIVMVILLDIISIPRDIFSKLKMNRKFS